ncbi:aldose 1-epimerase family protein [Microbacterium hydrocarbonoxydans]|uniref:aldose 1-epimerase family protein n=1 Tax=Microbacterium hydrocarbonoxydans TaxID=273678 RepID=UPI0020425C4B|nr:aldose 1-epimerase family protein [Microbacterium hydrocarbonoxydans]MCM3778197.1 aldose 1-epimerase family protein [Microbacterium hydrocarbonoxydans]
MNSASPTGNQVHLQLGEVSAQIAQVGASLRSLRIGSVDLVAPYPEDAPTPSGSGVVLVPWPNRVRDGRWDDDGIERQLAITEPKFGNASHGLLRFTAYEITEGASAATLRAWVVPQTGYPYLLETSVTYTLRADGIDVEHVITNRSETPAPVAVGSHPFLTIGDVAEADLVLRVSADTAIETDERMLPVGTHPIDPAVRDGVRVGDVSLDTGFIDLERDADGLARHSLTAPDGRRLTLWQGEGYEVVQVFTTDKYPGRPLAVAMEPMTAPADAFNSGTGLRRLAPGETWTLRWGITLD